MAEEEDCWSHRSESCRKEGEPTTEQLSGTPDDPRYHELNVKGGDDDPDIPSSAPFDETYVLIEAPVISETPLAEFVDEHGCETEVTKYMSPDVGERQRFKASFF